MLIKLSLNNCMSRKESYATRHLFRGRTVLMEAAMRGKFKMVKYLANLKNIDLFKVIIIFEFDVLIKYKTFNLFQTDTKGWTALMYANFGYKTDVINYLREKMGFTKKSEEDEK